MINCAVMKLTGDHLESYKPITTHTEISGVPYETIANLKGVQQLDKFDDSKAIVLMGTEVKRLRAERA